MAEGWARALAGDRIEPYSAGTAPGRVDPMAVQVMREAGIDISGHRSKSVTELAAVPFDAVVTVCDRANESCPVFPGAVRRIHAGFDDPPRLAAGALTEEEALGPYRRVRDEIRSFVLGLPTALDARGSVKKRLGFFERYLTLWVAVCMAAGVLIGKLLPGATDGLRRMEFGKGSQLNVPIAILIWLMIYPMMLKIDLRSLLGVGRRPTGLLVTLFVNWLVKPFSMAFLGWLFFKHLFLPFIGPGLADQYVAGVIILAAAPCTAMVFVWSYLTDGDPAYTLVQVSLNDLIMLVLFAPIVGFLVAGASGLHVPFAVLLYSVVGFIVIPLAAGTTSRIGLMRWKGKAWFEQRFLPFFHPINTIALLLTLVLIFAFQADNITGRFGHVLLIAVPILIQVYLNSGLAYGLMRLFRVPHSIAAPGALIGASNFFELAVAVAITLFGPDSGAALATVVGVLVEVPVMLSVCAFCNRTRDWFPTPATPGR
jgi:ACR3 family arsenite transporter